MDHVLWLVGFEAVIFAGAFVEAKVRNQYVVLRWAWWHLVIVWLAWFGVTWAVLAVATPATHRAAERTVMRSQAARLRASNVALVLDDD